jgi:hypothetical protein
MKQEDKLAIIVLFIQMAIKYGWPVIMALIENLKKDDITLDEIKALVIGDDEDFIPKGEEDPGGVNP